MSVFRRKKVLTISEPDPEYNVIYLGNVLSVLAKGDGCIDKPLGLIWRTYNSRMRPDLQMKLSVSKSGLKAVTKEQGLTEYWAHRITYCVASTEYPRVFAWIYKHDGKKMKPELRCHAVLCKKAEQAEVMTLLLHEKLSAALRDYKKEKLSRQNTRLSGTIIGIPSIPIRKQLLNVGAQNYRQPIHRCKSAPKLHSISEMEEEDEEELVVCHHRVTSRMSMETESFFGDDLSSSVVVMPGTPRELEFSASRFQYQVDMQIGNDIEKLRDDERVRNYLRKSDSLASSTGETEGDSISEESGYSDEKSNYEDEDVFDDDFAMTSL